MSAYVKSKALAERAAWDFAETDAGDLELSVVNPGGIFGPALSKEATSSLGLIGRLLGGMPGVPDIRFGVVDVRDVASLHLLALDAPEAAGERYIAWAEGPVSMIDVAALLRERLGDDAEKVPTRRLPSWLVKLVGRFNPEVGNLVPLLGEDRRATSEKARTQLGWTVRPWQDTIEDSARSLLDLRGS